MDRSTFSTWGSLICVVLVVAIMMAFATPFGQFVTEGVKSVMSDFKTTADEALNVSDIGGGNGGGDNTQQPLEGDGQEFDATSPAALTFRSPAPLSEFQSLKINGEVVDSSNYTLTEGSTVVTLKASYLETLSDGNYEVAIVSENMVAKGMFTVNGADSGNSCAHENCTYTYVSGGSFYEDNKHKVTCSDCGEVIAESEKCTTPVRFEDYGAGMHAGMCACGNEVTRDNHSFEPLGTTQHKCEKCNATENCDTSTGTCACGREGCRHENLRYVNGNTPSYTHEVYCQDCNELINDCESCEFETGNPVCKCGFTCRHYEYNNGYCTMCGAECTHESWTSNENGTHSCNSCGETQSCWYANVGAGCDYCGYGACTHVAINWEEPDLSGNGMYEHIGYCAECGACVEGNHNYVDGVCTDCEFECYHCWDNFGGSTHSCGYCGMTGDCDYSDGSGCCSICGF